MIGQTSAERKVFLMFKLYFVLGSTMNKNPRSWKRLLPENCGVASAIRDWQVSAAPCSACETAEDRQHRSIILDLLKPGRLRKHSRLRAD